MDENIIPLMAIVTLFIGLPWLVFHYVTKWKAQATLTTELIEWQRGDTSFRSVPVAAGVLAAHPRALRTSSSEASGHSPSTAKGSRWRPICGSARLTASSASRRLGCRWLMRRAR